MQTRALKSLIKVSKVGSFQKASEQLNMTLSALSMQMKGLEVELEVDLFDRSVRPPRLTAMGRMVVEKAEDIIESEDKLLELCSSADAPAGTFRVGFVTSASARLLPDFLVNSRRNLHHADFKFETGLSVVLQEKVRTGTLDAAVVTGEEVNPHGLAKLVLRDEPFVFAVHTSVAAKGLDYIIANHTFFHFMPQTGIGKVVAKQMSQINRPEHTQTIMLDNIEAIMGCVKNGLGFTLMPAPDVQRYANDEIVEFSAPDETRRSLIFVTRSDNVLAKHLNLIEAQFAKPLTVD